MIEPRKDMRNIKMKQPAKKITLAILLVAFIVGLVGCFLSFFDMDKFVKFLGAFLPFFLGMVASVGTGAVVDRIQGGKHDNKTNI
jgi:hypothetical protein